MRKVGRKGGNSFWVWFSMRRAKIFIWRIPMNGIFTLERAAKIGHRNGSYTICQGIIESSNHIFFDCRKALRAQTSNMIYFEGNLVDNILTYTSLLIKILDGGLTKSAKGLAFKLFLQNLLVTLASPKQQSIQSIYPNANVDLVAIHLTTATKYTLSHKKQ